MTFLEHIGELRARLIRSVFYYVVLVGVGFYFREWLFLLLRRPLPPGTKLYFFGVTEAFFFYFKIALIFGLVVGFPLFLFEIYGFFAPALKPNERKLIIPAIPVALILFILGAVFTFSLVLPASIRFLLSFSGEGLENILQVDKYYGFVIGLCIAGGLTFEMPVVLSIFARLGWVSAKGLLRNFRYALLIILTVTAIITPTPDAITMLVLSLPVIILYLVTILIVLRIKPISFGGE